VRVIAVAASGPFGKTALKAGMILLSVNGQPCHYVEEAATLLRNAVDKLTLVVRIDTDSIIVADHEDKVAASTSNKKQNSNNVNAGAAATSSAVGNNNVVTVELEQQQRLLMQQLLMQQQHQLQQQQIMLHMTTSNSSTAPPSSSSSSSATSTSGPSQNNHDNNYSDKSLKLLKMGRESTAKTNESSPNEDTVTTTTAIRVVDRATLTLETDLPSLSARRELSTTGMLQVTLRASIMGRPSKATKATLLKQQQQQQQQQPVAATMTDNEKKEHKRRQYKRYMAQKNKPCGIYIWMDNNTMQNQVLSIIF
jgi:hypothetical protein